jgi:NAD+ kinase
LKNPADQFKRAGLIANVDKKSGAPVIRKAAALLAAAGRTVLADQSTAAMAGLKVETCADDATLAKQCDLLLVFGGDGTMLRVARDVAGSRTPILGINLGNLGFLTAVPFKQMAEALERVLAGEFSIDSRPIIEATSHVMGRPFTQTALNDFVISRGAGSRMIELEVRVDEELLTRYRCDGLIVSAPTGSTAYSLSAGGAIVSPDAEVFTLTPICPHTLSNRSVIVSLASTITVQALASRPETVLAADGQVETKLNEGDNVVIRRSDRELRLVKLKGQSFFRTLRQKLNWSGSNV